MPSTIVERPSSVSTISAAARAASVDPVRTCVRTSVSTSQRAITCVSTSARQSTSQKTKCKYVGMYKSEDDH